MGMGMGFEYGLSDGVWDRFRDGVGDRFGQRFIPQWQKRLGMAMGRGVYILRRSIGGRTRMVCGCKHFCAWLLICVLLYVILPILPIAEEEEIAFDGGAPQHPKP